MDIVIKRGEVVKLDTLPKYSIAIDGFVSGPKIDADNNRFSFDHHGPCIRFCTASACYQVRTAILLGLEPNPYTVYINHVDADTCMSIWCLKNSDRCGEPLVKKLVDAICMGDMYGGAINLNGMNRTVEWISAPETDSKRNGDYEKLSDNGLLTIMESMLHRIDLYVNGDASIEIEKQVSHGEYKIMRNESNWVMVESHDPYVLSAVYRAGFDRVVITYPQEDESIAVTIAKRSDFIQTFPLKKIYNALNKLEPGWGGSSTIGGAPRNSDGSRTRLTLDVIASTVNNVISTHLKAKAKAQAKTTKK
jgi:hypothetical protein